jgi:CRISPR-associated protein Cst2
MNFLTGIYAIHAPASALNNGMGEETKAVTKKIRVGAREYPYVSAQAVRYWLRTTLERYYPEWRAAPIMRGSGSKQQAYTEGDPITYWDDDIFGYMRAEKENTLTRVAPFRTSTLVAAAPAEIVDDFGVMARMESNPVLHEHEFYRATLVGGFSVDLGALGTFTALDRSGYRNLSKEGVKRAQALNLEAISERAAYRLLYPERFQRLATLLRAFARLEGGAKQTLHYTDVSPAFVCMAVLRGGNNPFLHLLAPNGTLNTAALTEAIQVYREDYQSGIYVGLRQGFMDSAFEPLNAFDLTPMHPREAVEAFIADLETHPEWLA